MEGFSRPPAVTLPDGALIPADNLVSPPPDQFSHELIRNAPFYYAINWTPGDPPDGELPKGARVLLVVACKGAACRVIDERGLYVGLALAALRPLKPLSDQTQ